MWNTIYIVHSDVNENNIRAEFATKEEAIDYAKGSDNGEADQTWVEAIEVEVEEGSIVDEGDREVVWSYKDDPEAAQTEVGEVIDELADFTFSADDFLEGWDEVDEDYTGTPAIRTTHLEYVDDDVTDDKFKLPDNISKKDVAVCKVNPVINHPEDTAKELKEAVDVVTAPNRPEEFLRPEDLKIERETTGLNIADVILLPGAPTGNGGLRIRGTILATVDGLHSDDYFDFVFYPDTKEVKFENFPETYTEEQRCRVEELLLAKICTQYGTLNDTVPSFKAATAPAIPETAGANICPEEHCCGEHDHCEHHHDHCEHEIPVKVVCLTEDAEHDFKKMREDLEEHEDEVECQWCFDTFPKSECKREKDLGYLCPQCIAAIKSRGEELDFDESLEYTLEADLADDRTPVDDHVDELAEPLDANEVRKFEAGIEEK